MLNQIQIMGRVTQAPEMKQTASGVSMCRFSVAVDRDFKGRDGSRETDFFDCVAWRNTAEFVSNYIGKGRMVVVAGAMQSRKWTDRNGNNRISWEVQANEVYFGDSKRESGQAAESEQKFVEADADDENLPF